MMKSSLVKLLLVALMLTQILSVATAKIELPGLFSDHMVLQRHEAIPVWGWAEPGEVITVTLAEQSISATTDDSGKWSLKLAPMEAAMGLSMSVSGDHGEDSMNITDVAVGEVWLASGQSNMEWLLKRADMSQLLEKPNPMIRQYKGGSGDSRKPTERSRGAWVVDEGNNRLDFSAVGYYFALSLTEELDVPMGILNASVGGTAVETWMPREVVESFPGIREWSQDYWAQYEAYPEEQEAYVAALQEWRNQVGRVDPKEGVPAADLKPDSEKPWLPLTMPKVLPEMDYSGNGVLWIRNQFEVSEEAINEGRTYLRFYAYDAYLDTFVNGQLVQETTPKTHPGKGSFITVRIPQSVLMVGQNEILLRIDSPTTPLAFSQPFRVDNAEMDGDWEAQVEVDYGVLSETQLASAPQPLGNRVSFGRLPSVHYNTKIFPKIGYGIQGVIWYQGETNAQQGEAEKYATLFPAMIQSWRDLWGQPNLSFYYCQLASYGGKSASLESDSVVELRRAQEAALSLPNTGQVVLTDAGEGIIHPYDKRTPGERLARLALARNYGKDVVDSGPSFKSVRVDGDGVLYVRFDHVAEGLKSMPVPDTYPFDKSQGITRALVRNSPDSELEGFAVQSSDGSWHWADAKIEGDGVIIWTKDIPLPVALCYNWQRNPSGNLFNSEGLPAGPFKVQVPQSLH